MKTGTALMILLKLPIMLLNVVKFDENMVSEEIRMNRLQERF